MIERLLPSLNKSPVPKTGDIVGVRLSRLKKEPMATNSRKTVFTVRFNSRELETLQKEAEEREVPVAEMIRLCVQQTLIPISKSEQNNESTARAS